MMDHLRAHPLQWGWALLLVGIGGVLVWIGLGGTAPQPVGALAYEGDQLEGVVLRAGSTLEVTLEGSGGLRWDGGEVMWSDGGYVWVEVAGASVFAMQLWPHLQPEANRVWLSVRAHTLTVRVNDEVVWSGEAVGLPYAGFQAEGVERVRWWAESTE